jgi:serine/threonine-protein kinase
MSLEPPADDTAPHGLDEGIGLALRAQDSGDWKPVVDWLAQNPALAERLARFVGGERDLSRALSPPRPAAAPGTVLGNYELVEQLGRGAMGVVYRARDQRVPREVAVKVIRTEGMSDTELGRVRFEAEAMADLHHPNVVPLFDFDETPDQMFFAMPLMPGGSLAKRLKDLGPDRCLPPKEAAGIVRDVALGVHHAHQRGLIHRDLKPANVLLDATGRPHVADFGLARRADATASTAAGSPAYMAPEQARGERHLTTAADVHALGVVLFELLTGRPPFGGGDVASVLRRVIDDPAPAVGDLRPGLPRDLDAVCRKCLEKRPEARYASAQALADDLDRYLAGEPVKARPRGLFAEVAGAFGWQRESSSFVTWRGVAYGAVNTAVNHTAVAALAFAGYPQVAFAVLAYHILTWAAFVWWFGVRARVRLTAVERSGIALHLGGIAAVAVTLPIALATTGPHIAAVYPVYNAVIGCLLFAHGTVDRGRHYLSGLLWMSQNLLLPFLPVWAWAALHAVVGAVVHVAAAMIAWRVDRVGLAARAAPPTD